MKQTKVKIHTVLGRFVCVAITTGILAGSAYAYAVYHGINKVALPSLRVEWTKDNFGVSGDTLSYMYFANDAAATEAAKSPLGDFRGISQSLCLVKVDLPGVPAVPAANITADVGGALAGVKPGNLDDKPRVFPWKIKFDNDPAGHWSIAKVILVEGNEGTNAAAGRVAAAGHRDLANLAVNPQVTVINGTMEGCQP